jgi:transposase
MLPFTYDDLMYIMAVDKKKASEVAVTTPKARCNRRGHASSTPCHSSVAALNERGDCFMDMRELKGLEIAARSRIDFKDGAWTVPSQSSNGTYRVILAPHGDTCTCEDFSLRQLPCKHILAARIVRERDFAGKGPIISTDEVPKRKTYKQDWPAYNLAQRTEKHRFQELLADLCRPIEGPPPARTGGYKPHLYRDSVFAMAFKVYSTFSTRRFNCDLADAHERGYTVNAVPSMKVCEFLQNDALTPILHDLIVRSSLPLKAVESVFAPDSTGFSTSRFVRWYDEKYGVQRSGKDWVKAHAICGVKTNVVTHVVIEGRDTGDCPQLKRLVEKTAENFTVKEVPADKGYLSKENFAVTEGLGATAYIPFKVNNGPNGDGLWDKMFFYYSFHREEFLKHYHQRSNAESTFSMVKAKFRDHVRSKTDTAMKNEVLCKFLAHNICVCIQSQCELGIEPVFWSDKPALTAMDVIPFPQTS